MTYGSDPATSGGTTLTAGAANVKGAWVQLTAATTRDASWIDVNLAAVSAIGRFVVDIGIGAATEQIIMPDLFATAAEGNVNCCTYSFRLFIPAGSRLVARVASTAASATIQIIVKLYSGTTPLGGSGPSLVATYGTITSGVGPLVDPGAVANTDSAWVEMTASTVRDHHSLVLAGRFGDSVLAGATRWLVDIGIGAATEQELISDILFSAGITADNPTEMLQHAPVFVAKGSRLTCRLRSNSVTAGDRAANLLLYGN
ncbi:MAG: hypothetical protein H0U59_07220 [Gemmatimonadaceae bacterium]|nr:hypothetical protein [Gemmatimonadaceae bacterium]